MIATLNAELERTGVRLVEIGPDVLGDDFADFLGYACTLTDGRTILAMPLGQHPDVREAVARHLLTVGGAL